MKKAAWIVGVVVFALVSLAILKFAPDLNDGASSVFPVRKPIATAKFEDGIELQILQAGLNTLQDGRLPVARKVRFFSFGGPRTSEMGGGYASGISYRYAKEDGKLTGFRMESDEPCLLLETRCLMENGKLAPLPLDPGMVVQISDGCGGWLNGRGPAAVVEDKEARSVVSFPVWPRQLSTLTVRVLKSGVSSLAASMPNPSVTPSEHWKCDASTARLDEKDFSLEIENCTLKQLTDQAPEIQINTRFQSKLPQAHGMDPLLFSVLSLCDNMGNEVVLEGCGNASGVPGFQLPGSASQFRLRGVVVASGWYSIPLSGCTILAEGVISPDGTRFIPDAPFVRKLGADSVQLETNKRGEDVIHFKLKGACTDAELSSIETVHGAMNCWRLVVFLDADIQSSGYSSYSVVDKMNWEWFGKLQPNQRIRFGVTAPIPDVPVELTFDRSWIRE